MGLVDRLNTSFERLCFAGKWASRLYRLSHHAYLAGIPLLPYLIQMANAMAYGCEIHYKAKIGKGLQIAHPRGIVIGQNVEAGRNLKVYTGVVLGVKHTGLPDQPRIGDNVTLYAGAKVLGGVALGDNVTVGANAVVTRDVEPNVFVAGIPARVIKRIEVTPCTSNT